MHATVREALGTVAVVTGGSRGIGRAVVERLSRRGHVVVFTYSDDDEAARAVRRDVGSSVVPLRCDVTAPDAPTRILDAAQAHGEVTILVNNAGVTGPIGPLATVSDETIRRVLEVNLTATLRLCREAVTRWQVRDIRGDRSIVNISSVAARTGAPGEYIWYAASKAGVETLTVGLAKEIAPLGARVNAVSPGTTDTAIHARAGRPGRAADVGMRTPMGRAAAPDEIAATVDWLTTADASYITGSVISVSGGMP